MVKSCLITVFFRVKSPFFLVTSPFLAASPLVPTPILPSRLFPRGGCVQLATKPETLWLGMSVMDIWACEGYVPRLMNE